MAHYFEKVNNLMDTMINNIGDQMIVTARCVNIFLESWYKGEESGNLRNNPHYSEFQGMCQLLKAMDVDYDIEYDREVVKMTAIVIMGKRFEV